MSVVSTVTAPFRWTYRQVTGTASNAWTWLTERLSLEDIIIPAVYDTAVWLTNQVPLALGGGEPGEMIEASFVLGVAAVVSSLISFGATLVFVGLFAFTGFLGALRFIPVVEEYWPIGEWRIGDSESLGVL
jgi:hypothetical protein